MVHRIGEFVDTYVSGQAGTIGQGQVCYPAVVVGEPAGKPIRHCRTELVSLTVIHPSDAEVLHTEGSPALRRVRLARVCSEAYRQKAVLGHEDLSLLLAVDLSTVGRLVQQCAAEGNRPPTRGLIQDIGPTISHKERVIKLYFKGQLPLRIASSTGHSLGSVERYLADFGRVVALSKRGMGKEVISRITGLSDRLVGAYLKQAEKYDRPEHRSVLERLMLRFGPLEIEEESDG
ncbi:MAG: DUF1670 domain-containing protein [bacterium]|nr:DUF1670 domain-containing protein [bacterium]